MRPRRNRPKQHQHEDDEKDGQHARSMARNRERRLFRTGHSRALLRQPGRSVRARAARSAVADNGWIGHSLWGTRTSALSRRWAASFRGPRSQHELAAQLRVDRHGIGCRTESPACLRGGTFKNAQSARPLGAKCCRGKMAWSRRLLGHERWSFRHGHVQLVAGGLDADVGVCRTRLLVCSQSGVPANRRPRDVSLAARRRRHNICGRCRGDGHLHHWVCAQEDHGASPIMRRRSRIGERTILARPALL